MKCEGATGPCESTEDVREEPCRTAYYVEPCEHTDCLENEEMRALCYQSRDPNKSAWLCRPCAAEYHAGWDEIWGAYYAGLM